MAGCREKGTCTKVQFPPASLCLYTSCTIDLVRARKNGRVVGIAPRRSCCINFAYYLDVGGPKAMYTSLSSFWLNLTTAFDVMISSIFKPYQPRDCSSLACEGAHGTSQRAENLMFFKMRCVLDALTLPGLPRTICTCIFMTTAIF